MKPKHYYNDTFQTNYWFFIGVSSKYFIDYMKKFYNVTIDIDQRCNGKTLQIEKENAVVQIVWVKDKKRLDVLAHECVHAANMTFYGIGLPASYDNDETQAYLVQALFNKAIL